jgi:hypothetical protein
MGMHLSDLIGIKFSIPVQGLLIQNMDRRALNFRPLAKGAIWRALGLTGVEDSVRQILIYKDPVDSFQFTVLSSWSSWPGFDLRAWLA